MRSESGQLIVVRNVTRATIQCQAVWQTRAETTITPTRSLIAIRNNVVNTGTSAPSTSSCATTAPSVNEATDVTA